MKIVNVIDEDFVNYKKVSMVIGFPYCSFKCGKDICQNSQLSESELIDISIDKLIDRYMNNQYSNAIVCAGLEPFDSWNDLYELISSLRKYTDDDFIIYTGYNKFEIEDKVATLSQFKNIIIKFGRYINNNKSIYDEILGINLASDNQYAERIS